MMGPRSLLLLLVPGVIPQFCGAFSTQSPSFHNTRRIHSTRPAFLLHTSVEDSELPSTLSSSSSIQTPSTSRRIRFLNRLGFKRAAVEQKYVVQTKKRSKKPTVIYNITDAKELEEIFEDPDHLFRDDRENIDYDFLLRSITVQGDTQIIGSPDHPDYVHPVAKLLYERKRNKSVCSEGPRPDGAKVALVIEGGGMRGCVTAGMVCALDYLGLRDTFDVVYGSSAGSMIGAYFITGQLPWYGPEVYYDKLTTAGKEFIDTKRLLRSLGLGLVDPRLLRDVLTRRRNGKPVLSLSFLLKSVMQETKALDWNKFVERQKVQQLRVVASGLKSEEPFVMDMENKHFQSLEELSQCMHASMLLPGIAGPVMNFNRKHDENPDKPKFICANNIQDPDYEPLGDALIYGPMPYDIAHRKGATHVVVLRSRPDGNDVTGKGGVFERLIFRRFFTRKNKLPGVFDRMKRQYHKRLYGMNVLEMNKEAYSKRDYKDLSKLHLMTMALPPGSPEVARLEVGREAIFEGVRRGFARVYDALVEDPAERGRGAIVAKEYFPDEILDYDPADIPPSEESAFATYLKKSGITPKSWNGSSVQPTYTPTVQNRTIES
jgi:predicted acylesterase/phospholipase RssA